MCQDRLLALQQEIVLPFDVLVRGVRRSIQVIPLWRCGIFVLAITRLMLAPAEDKASYAADLAESSPATNRMARRQH
jgi:hypothetical protein